MCVETANRDNQSLAFFLIWLAKVHLPAKAGYSRVRLEVCEFLVGKAKKVFPKNYLTLKNGELG